jgi:hypothetical protein
MISIYQPSEFESSMLTIPLIIFLYLKWTYSTDASWFHIIYLLALALQNTKLFVFL